MLDSKAIIESIRRISDKDSKSYKITEYYINLINGSLDEGGVAIATSRIKSIEKELNNWVKKHSKIVSNIGSNIMQPEENALILIKDLREKELIK